MREKLPLLQLAYEQKLVPSKDQGFLAVTEFIRTKMWIDENIKGICKNISKRPRLIIVQDRTGYTKLVHKFHCGNW